MESPPLFTQTGFGPCYMLPPGSCHQYDNAMTPISFLKAKCYLFIRRYTAIRERWVKTTWSPYTYCLTESFTFSPRCCCWPDLSLVPPLFWEPGYNLFFCRPCFSPSLLSFRGCPFLKSNSLLCSLCPCPVPHPLIAKGVLCPTLTGTKLQRPWHQYYLLNNDDWGCLRLDLYWWLLLVRLCHSGVWRSVTPYWHSCVSGSP